jgi:hypothetical protein
MFKLKETDVSVTIRSQMAERHESVQICKASRWLKESSQLFSSASRCRLSIESIMSIT